MTEAQPDTPAGRSTGRRVLEVATVRVPLIHDLAVGGAGSTILAARYGVTYQAIHAFTKRHAEEIAAVRDDINNELSGVWIAKQRARLLHYQQMVEEANGVPVTRRLGDPALYRVIHSALRTAAEEMGVFRTVVDATVSMRFELVGVDPVDLT